MKNSRISRRSLLKGAAVAAPYVITSAALGNADTPPASQRVTLGHIGVGVRGLVSAFLQFHLERQLRSLPMVERV